MVTFIKNNVYNPNSIVFSNTTIRLYFPNTTINEKRGHGVSTTTYTQTHINTNKTLSSVLSARLVLSVCDAVVVGFRRAPSELVARSPRTVASFYTHKKVVVVIKILKTAPQPFTRDCVRSENSKRLGVFYRQTKRNKSNLILARLA